VFKQFKLVMCFSLFAGLCSAQAEITGIECRDFAPTRHTNFLISSSHPGALKYQKRPGSVRYAQFNLNDRSGSFTSGQFTRQPGKQMVLVDTYEMGDVTPEVRFVPPNQTKPFNAQASGLFMVRGEWTIVRNHPFHCSVTTDRSKR